ncbi:MAG: choice-of-anchor V domain-containing protein [Chitinophagales bacterium]
MKLKFIYLASFLLTIFLITVNQSSVYTRSNGTIIAKTGAPGENTCAQCHSGSSGGGGSVTLLVDGSSAPGTYVAGQVYSMTVEIEDPLSSEYGFQMVFLNPSNAGPATGGFSAIPGTWLQMSGTKEYITHNTPKTTAANTETATWVFDWTAPNPADGNITFYLAGNATNNNGSTSGDKVYTTSLTFNAPIAACEITNLTAMAQACDASGNFDVVLDLDVTSAGANNTFTVSGNGTNYGTFNYNDLPITLTDLAGDNTTNYQFEVTDTNDSNCSANTTLGVIDCPDCVISNFTATAQTCDTDGTFDVVIDLDVAAPGASNTFALTGNGNNYGTFNYNDLPITLPNLVGDNSTDYTFAAQDSDLSNCTSDTNLGLVDCPVCSISNFTATPQACGTDGMFDVVLDFDVANPGASGLFSITGNGNTYGLTSYANLPLTIENLVGDNSTDYEFIVTDNNLADCNASANVGIINCPVCSISDLSVEETFCDLDGTFDVVIDFSILNPGNSGFTVAGNGTNYGTFQYSDLPLTIENLVGDNSTAYEFVVTDVELQDCSASMDLGLINCPVCSISDLSVTQGDCQTDGTFDVVIDFNVANTISDFFNIAGNGTDYGDFEYSDLPITIENLTGDNSTAYEFVVTDAEDTNCSTSMDLGVVNCAVCSISDLSVTQGDCQMDGTFDAVINFNVSSPVSNTFAIAGNGTNYGTFEYANLPITIENLVGDNSTAYEFVVTDTDDSNCSASMTLGVVDCPICNISDLSVTQGDCQMDGTFDVVVNFNVANPSSNSFTLVGNGTNYGTFEYANLPITIENLVGDNSTAYEFIVTDTENANCSAATGLGVVNCPVCSISDLSVTQGDCQTDGTFDVVVNFNAANPSSDSFTLAGNGTNYGTFEYANLPITIENLVGDNSTAYEFVVTDMENSSCSASMELGVVDCPICSISNLTVDLGMCNDNGTYSLTLNFEHENTASVNFGVFSGETSIGSFAYADLPVTIEAFQNMEGAMQSITVSDNDNLDCSATTEFEGLDCPVLECFISNVVAEAHECDEDGNFLVDIDFDVVDGGSMGFTIVGNGTNYGTFEYGMDFYTIGPLAGDGETIYEFIVSDVENEGCSDFTGFEAAIDCSPPCNIFDVAVDLGSCNDDGTYSLTLNFEHENTTNDSFDLHFGEVSLGSFPYSDLPLTIESFPTDGGDFDSITISDNDNADCSTTFEFEALDCPVIECAIGELAIEVLDCDDDGNFAVSISFAFEDVGDEGFKVRGNGMDYGNFSYSDLPIILSGLAGDGETDYEFIVIDNAMEDCSSAAGIGTIECAGGTCSISNIIAEASDCDDDGNFFVDIQFSAEFGSEQGFTIVGNGNNYGNFQYGQDFYTVGPLAGDGSTIYEFVVTDIQNADCSAAFVFEETIDCGGNDCSFSEISVTTGDCNDDGTYSLTLDFVHENTTNNFFELHFGETSLGTFEYSDLPVMIEAFPTDGGDFDSITISDNDNADCSTTVEFEALDCPIVQCAIANVVAEAHECDVNGQFFVDVSFDIDNPASQSFRIRGNGNDYGTFVYGAPFYTIGPLVGDGTTIYEFIVTDLEDENCSDFATLEAVNCTPPTCNIFNVTTSLSDCGDDGTFDLSIDFDFENISEAGFGVWINEELAGEFAYDELPVVILELDANAVTVYNIGIGDLGFEDCEALESFNSPDCPVTTCTADAGTMPTEMVMVCDGDTEPIAAEGTVLENDDVLVYVLHTSPDETLGDIIEIFFSPQVSNANLSASTNTEYYFSAVAGPEGDTDDNFPDLNSECTKIAAGTPVVFLQPIELVIEEDCDVETGVSTVTASVSGGVPSFEEFASYTVTATESEEILVMVNESFAFSGMFSGDTYFINVVDANNCTSTFTSETIDCLIDNIKPQIPFSFSLEELSPNPVSDWLHLEITADIPQDVTMRVYDVAGRILLEDLQSLNANTNTVNLDMSLYPSGVYLLYLQNAEGVLVERFVVD